VPQAAGYPIGKRPDLTSDPAVADLPEEAEESDTALM